MKVIFLDFDEVLNDYTHDPHTQAYWDDPLMQVYVDRLNTIIEATKAEVVLCTSWRNRGRGGQESGVPSCIAFLADHKFKGKVIGATPDMENFDMYQTGLVPRWREIKSWLDGHPDVTKFVILDDIKNMGPFAMSHVAPLSGLTKEDTDLAIEILNG